MKLSILLLAASSLLTISASAQQKIGSNNIGTISEIMLSGKLNVTYIPSENNAIEINLYNADISKLRWNIKDSVLNVTLKPSRDETDYADVKIWSTSPLSKLGISEANFSSDNVISSEMIELILSSSSKLTATINAIDIEVKIDGAAIADISGESTYLDIVASEGSRIDTRKMSAISCEIESSSNSEVYVDAAERLVATAKTGSTIFYTGDPIIMKLTTPKIAGLGAGIHKIKIPQ